MTMHEKECALAAIGLLLEKATSTRERRTLRTWLKKIINAPIEDETMRVIENATFGRGTVRR
jgi:hypothetical protein